MAGQIALTTYIATQPLSPEELFKKLTVIIFLETLVSMLPWFAWIWATGSFLSSLQQASLSTNLKIFRLSLVFPLPYICLFFLVFQSSHPEWFIVIFPLHLAAMSCIIYLMYFVSKNLSQVEIGRSATFSDCAGYFFLIWFYPIGIWIIQPKINRLYKARRNQT